MNKALVILGMLILAKTGYAQVVSTSTSQLSTTAGSEVAIKTTGNVTLAQDVSNATVDLELSGSAQTISENLTLRKLSLTGSGDKTITKSLTITGSIDFLLGILKPSASGKILYSGVVDGISGGNDNSYVDGFFFNQTKGEQFFPLGALNLGYAPATIIQSKSQNEIGMRVINLSPNFIPNADSEVKKLDNTHYWEVSTTNIADISSLVKLSLKGVDPTLAFGDSTTLSVVQADNIGGVVEGLDGSDTNEDVTSARVFTKAFLGVGASKELTVSVIDIITPGGDGFNDYLNILHIDKFEIRRVKLLDRYGLLIKDWPEYVNGATNGYDFNRLSSGSYICIVEYGNIDSGIKSIQQMVSVIKY